MPPDPPHSAPTWETEIILGRAAILAHSPLLIELSERTGQPGAMDHLHYFLHFRSALKKTPHLVLIRLKLGISSGPVLGALLLHEFRPLGLPTRLFATDDASGRRTLLAPAALRTAIARRAAEALLRHGALAVFQSFVETQPDDTALLPYLASPEIFETKSWQLATQRRLLSAFLPLESTFDTTLAKIGQRTRSNMRYYRRRAEKELGCTFFPEAPITRNELIAFNRQCSFAVSNDLAAWRFDSITALPSGFLCGIRGSIGPEDGRWLAVLGARRYADTVEIDWQMNRADLPLYSLSTVLRAYLIEHEIARGTRKLFIEGGTPHAMRFSFEMHTVRDLIVVKHLGLLRRCVPLLPALRAYINRVHPEWAFILKILAHPQLTWHPWSTPSN